MGMEGSCHQADMGRNPVAVEMYSRVAAIASLLLLCGTAACASVVIVEEAPSGSSSEGGGTGGGDPGLEPQQGGCSGKCVGTSDGNSCSCKRECDGHLNKISCAPIVNELGEEKIECVCTVEDYFSGVCFETHPSHMCDIV